VAKRFIYKKDGLFKNKLKIKMIAKKSDKEKKD
jgi:hypothetical protein